MANTQPITAAATTPGEFRRATAIGIFPARNGMPCGDKLSPVTVSCLVRETLAA